MLMLQLNPKETDITNGVKFTNITNITLRRASTHRVVREVVLCLAAKKTADKDTGFTWSNSWISPSGDQLAATRDFSVDNVRRIIDIFDI